MADSAFITQYRSEFIEGFEQRQSYMRDLVTTDTVINGNVATFLVADSGGAEAVTRGINGYIPTRGDNLNQFSATLQEWHDIPERTGFNIFASQADGRRIMQEGSMGVINRKIDQDILNELNTATQTTGTATTGSLDLITRAIAILGNNKVPIDGQIGGVISPAFLAYIMRLPTFTSADYRNDKPLEATSLMSFRWGMVNFVVHPSLPGAGTNAERCFIFHKSAIGHAYNTDSVVTIPGYDEKQDISWCRTSQFMGSKLLQNSGVVVMNHDGSALAASA